MSIPGLTACRLAAALTERDLAQLIGSDQPSVNVMYVADCYELRRLCRALKVWPMDLINDRPVEDAAQRADRSRRPERAFEQQRAERRHQVNMIKRQRAIFCTSSSVRLAGLKACRLEAGLSQRKLARMVGTNQTTIVQLEKRYASRGAYISTIRKLSRALGVSPADVICT